MSRVLETVKALLPQGRAFALFREKNLRLFMKALSALPGDVRAAAEQTYLDLFPDSTACLEKWEGVFALYFLRQEREIRRQILEASWRMMRGGQSASFLEGVLQIVDDRIRVIENVPVSDPLQKSVVYKNVLGGGSARCGYRKAVCGYCAGNDGFVPDVFQNGTGRSYSGAVYKNVLGGVRARCGHRKAVCGYYTISPDSVYSRSEYNIPHEPDYWRFCFFIGGGEVRNKRNNQIQYIQMLWVNMAWRNFVEYIVLKIKPAHTTAVVFIAWGNTQ